MQIRDRVVLITGASAGIGAACAAAFRARGARLALLARSREGLEQVARPGELAIAGDVTKADVRSSAIDSTVQRFGRLDILINNAGAGLYVPGHRAPLDSARELFELNFFAPAELSQLAIRRMREQREGLIVNVSSIAGKVTLPWFTFYSAGKAALGALTDGLRMELAGTGVRTMLVCPGYVTTQFQQNVLAGHPPPLTGLRKRWAITPQACAEAIARGVERGTRTLVVPWTGWLLIALARVLPRLVESQMEKVYRQQEAQV